MGWTSKIYREYSHTGFNKEQAYELCYDEFNTGGYEIDNFHYKKANDSFEHHECYLRIKHPSGKLFIMVVIIDINDDEIYWKEIEESLEPFYNNCPIEMFIGVVAPNDYATNWRGACARKKIKLNGINET